MKAPTMIALFLIIGGCSKPASDAFDKSFDESFRSSFKSSFVESCSKGHDKEEISDKCSCIADDLLSSLSKSELTEIDKVKKRLNEVSSKKCKITARAG